MGDFFELQEAGYLDAMREYTGKGFSSNHSYTHNPANHKVKSLLRGRGIKTHETRGKAVKGYADHLKIKRDYTLVCNVICTDTDSYMAFKEWLSIQYPKKGAAT